MNIVTLSSQNQITLPVGLGLTPRGRFWVDKQDDKIILEPIRGSIIDDLTGSLASFIPQDKRNVSWETALREAKIAKAKKVANDS